MKVVWHSLFVIAVFSWDESSSISSGLSDGSDNLSSEEFNTSPTLNSLPTTPIGSRRNSAIVVSNAHVSIHTHTPTHTELSNADGWAVSIKMLIRWGISAVLNDVSFTQQVTGHWHQRQSLIKYSVHTHNIYDICNDQCLLQNTHTQAHTHCKLNNYIFPQGCLCSFVFFMTMLRANLGDF